MVNSRAKSSVLMRVKNSKATKNRSNKKVMQKKIAMMLILMMMAGLDAHGARDLHPGLRKNFSYGLY